METNEKMDELLKGELVTEEVKEEIKQVILTRLTQGFQNYCRDIKNKYAKFVKLIGEREWLAEDAAPDIDFLIKILQTENKELRNISEAFSATNNLLEDFNSKLKPTKPPIVTSQQIQQGEPLPQIESAEKNVSKIHGSYFEVCTALGLDPNTMLAMQTYTEMGYQEVQKFIANQKQAASKEAEDQHSGNAVVKTSELATEQSHVNLGEKEKDKLADNREIKTYRGLITQLEKQADSVVSNGSTKSLNITDLGPIPQYEEDPLDPELQLALALSQQPLSPSTSTTLTSQEHEKLNTEIAEGVLLQNLENKPGNAAKPVPGFGNSSS